MDSQGYCGQMLEQGSGFTFHVRADGEFGGKMPSSATGVLNGKGEWIRSKNPCGNRQFGAYFKGSKTETCVKNGIAWISRATGAKKSSPRI